MQVPGRHRIALAEADSLKLLGTTRLGRVVFHQNALPMIRPVNHVLVGGDLAILSHEGAALPTVIDLAGIEGLVVAYETDRIDEDNHTGWSVIITGTATMNHDPGFADVVRAALTPWSAEPMAHVIRVTPELVTGFRLS